MAKRIIGILLFVLLRSAGTYGYDAAWDRLLSGTPIYSGTQSKALLAFDGDASTYYSTSSDAFGWVGLDLGEPYVITRIVYTPASGSQGADRCLLSLFEGANSPDFMDAVPLQFIGATPPKDAASTTDVTVSRGFRYVRYVGSTGSYCNIAELQFYGHAGEGDDSQFFQITNLPTLSIHVKDNVLPMNRGEDFESQSLLIYDGGTRIQDYPVLFRVRGNYSSTHENKAFRIKYNDDKSHHMMRGSANESPTKCKKWVLINSYRDKTLMRNPVAWAMSKRGEKEWTPWCQVVDLVVNGDYRGTYTLADAISVDRNRINITEMTATDIDEENITGGYLVEADNNYSRETYHFLSSHGGTMSVHEPDEDIMQPQQFQYIQNTWNAMENVVFGADYTDREKGLRSVVDIESFVKWFLISEFNGNTDMICQVFLFKERDDSHFYTGPVWDADLALENDETTYPANQRMDWTYKVRQTGRYGQFVSRILSDPSVFASLQEYWAKMRGKGNFDPELVAADVDSIRNEIRASANLNFIRWPYLNQWLSLNPAVPGSWEAEVDRVRDFVRDRVAWMDDMLSYGKVRQDANGIYQIGSGLDLVTFAKMVNEGGETDASAVFVADIDMTDYNDEFMPMGSASAPFSGSLDGQGHTIRGLHLKGTDAVGLFGIASYAKLRNIVFDKTCSAEGRNYVSLLLGQVRNGTTTISGIENHGSVTASGTNAGALVGHGRLLSVFNITNCSNTGTIKAESGAAALVGPTVGKLSIENSYNTGAIEGSIEGKDFGFGSKSLAINNCWDFSSTQTLTMSAEQVDNGYLCYQLNAGGGGDTWHQNLDNGREHDPYPVLRRSAGMVYERDGRYSNINVDAARYRYYNLVVTELQDYGSSLQFSEFDLLDESLEEVASLSIYDGPDGYGDEGYENATDNDVSTKYCGRFVAPACFLFDAGSEVDAFGYRIYTGNDTGNNPSRNPCSWKLYGSNTRLTDPDDDAWMLIDERTDDNTMQATNYTPYDFFIPHSLRTLTLSRRSAMLQPGDELQLEASFTPASMQNLKLQWTSTNDEVAIVDQSGRVRAVGLGKASIILSAPNVSMLKDTCTVTVVETLPGHRYYLWAVEQIRGGATIQLSEFDLLDRDGAEVEPLSAYLWTGTYIKDHDPADLFDDDTSTKYCAAFDPTYTLYIYIDAGQPVMLSGYRMTTAADSQTYPGRNPKTWSLFGSNTKLETPDGDWTLLDRRDGDTALGAANFMPYDFFFTYPQPITMGDVNGDAIVDHLDYEAMRLHIVGLTPEGFVAEAADLNGDGKVNAQDLVLLARMLNGNDN